MPITDSDLYRDAIRRTLMHRAGGDAPDASAIAETTLNTWHQVEARLSPVIGARGVDVLLGRSLHLTSAIFPWLAIAGNQGDSATVLVDIKERLAGNQTDTAKEASYTLLATFVDLLATLIGKSLTERLMGPIWAPPSPTSKKERLS